MGVHNVEQAGLLAKQNKVGHRARGLLYWMANKALDETGRDGAQPRLYFAGRDHLAIGLGYDATQCDLPAVRRAVKDTIAELVEAGLIERDGTAYTGHQATYRLLLPPKPVQLRPPALAAVTHLRRTGTGDI